ncbi:MAG: EFR1 family ferrodoxin [Candidatus Margulisiibacteriota bacterium]
MKTNIYYFSATGNSLAIAKDIAAGIPDAKTINIAKAIKEELDLSADAIGIVFPVYMWGLPLIIVDFLKKFANIKNKYIFAAATYGGFPGATLQQAANILNDHGTKLNAGFAVNMPGNYTPMYGAKPKNKQEALFNKAEKKVQEIIRIVSSKQDHKIEKNSFLINLLFSSFLYKGGIKTISKADLKYWADEKCDGCGICAKVCPVNNIKIENNKPVWLHHCQHCLACLQWCPKEAIQFGNSTSKRKRYHHPRVALNDILS